jgi:hypothetical protein
MPLKSTCYPESGWWSVTGAAISGGAVGIWWRRRARHRLGGVPFAVFRYSERSGFARESSATHGRGHTGDQQTGNRVCSLSGLPARLYCRRFRWRAAISVGEQAKRGAQTPPGHTQRRNHRVN